MGPIVEMAFEVGLRSPVNEQRKIAAILIADIAGYSRLMGADEEATLAQLRSAEPRHLREVMH